MTTDPVDLQRARWRRAVSFGLRGGYALYGLAIILFIIGLAWRFESWLADAIVWCVALGSVLLAPAIVFSYGLKAAERHDREIGA